MSSIQTFHFQNQQVRSQVINGQIWWIARDVCNILGLSNVTWMTKRLEDDEFSQTKLIDAQGRNQTTTIINESGLYSAILRSDKPNAKPFRKWVTSEVLPAIRKNGTYSSQSETPTLSTSVGYEQRGDGIYYRYDPKSNYFYNYRLSEAAIINAIITKISRLASVLEKKEWRGEMAYAEVKHHDTGETLYHPQAVERVCLLFDLDFILNLRQF